MEDISRASFTADWWQRGRWIEKCKQHDDGRQSSTYEAGIESRVVNATACFLLRPAASASVSHFLAAHGWPSPHLRRTGACSPRASGGLASPPRVIGKAIAHLQLFRPSFGCTRSLSPTSTHHYRHPHLAFLAHPDFTAHPARTVSSPFLRLQGPLSVAQSARSSHDPVQSRPAQIIRIPATLLHASSHFHRRDPESPA